MTRNSLWKHFVGAAILVLALATAPLSAAGKKPAAGKKLEPGKIHHLTSEKHGRAYSLYVPSGYSPKVSWPLVISSHGRGGRGKNEINPWKTLANAHGLIVACPDMLTATTEEDLPGTSGKPRAEEDEEVLLSIFETISSRFRVNRRAVMITGFSGGGNPSYWTGLRHPDVFTHICTRGGNWAPQELPKDEAVIAAGKDRLRIFIFYGEKDHVLILGEGGKPGQAVQAYEALKKAGYAHLAIEKVPGMKHESRPKKAAEWFGEFLTANRKKFAAGDEVDGLVVDAKAAIAKKDYRKAGRALSRARDIEKKHGLESRVEAELAALNEIGMKIVGEAKEAHA
ncbi:MAG: alpha/beta hydrolase-fold protein, partial [Planctomycetota bacterium]